MDFPMNWDENDGRVAPGVGQAAVGVKAVRGNWEGCRGAWATVLHAGFGQTA